MSKNQISKIPASGDYGLLVDEIGRLLEQSRRQAARTINNLLTATYWEIGRRIVEFEQGGEARAEYGGELLVKLSADLTARYGRGFSRPGLQRMRTFYLEWEICSTPSSELEARAGCAELYSQIRILARTQRHRTSKNPWKSRHALIALRDDGKSSPVGSRLGRWLSPPPQLVALLRPAGR